MVLSIIKSQKWVSRMNKQQLLEYIQGLPDNLQVEPIAWKDMQSESVGDINFIGLTGSVYPAVYEMNTRCRIALTLNYTSTMQAEFQRDNKGIENWTNARLVN